MIQENIMQTVRHEKRDTIAGIPPFRGAASGTRTRDPQLGKLMLYQLSYCRVFGSANVGHILEINNFLNEKNRQKSNF